MSSFNLYSNNTIETKDGKTKVRLTFPMFIILGFLLVVVILAVASAFTNFYYDSQVKDKGNALISLMSQQSSKYTDTINNITGYNAKKSATEDITKNRVLMESVVNELDTKSNNTLVSYEIDKRTGNILLVGSVTKIDDAVSILTSLRQSTMFSNPSLTQVVSDNQNGYTYNISLMLNTNQ